MRRVLLSLILVGLMALPALAQCGPRGCPTRRPAIVEKSREKIKVKTRPTPAWRYERAVGHRASVVRVECDDGRGVWSKGSGVLVRWGKRVVVLTARHVIRDAKRVFVRFHNGKRVKVRVLKVDARWDCCVLGIDQPPDDIQPAEMAYGVEAKFKDGDRLESAGYGSDEQLAVNVGLFKGYRRSSQSPDQGPDDWMVISGHARGGDSGGPVFDAKGRVVGVLWGTDGTEVVCVQAGRLHVLLDEAVAVSYDQQGIFDRNPTPPSYGPLEPISEADQIKLGKKPLLPWRGETEAKDSAQDARIDRLIGLMEGQVQVRPGPSIDVQVGPKPPIEPPTEQGPPLWLWGLGGLATAGFIYYVGGKN